MEKTFVIEVIRALESSLLRSAIYLHEARSSRLNFICMGSINWLKCIDLVEVQCRIMGASAAELNCEFVRILIGHARLYFFFLPWKLT